MSEDLGKTMERMIKQLQGSLEAHINLRDTFARLQEAMREETLRRFAVWVEEDVTTPPDWQGFRGLLGVVDECLPNVTIWDHNEYPQTFTPEEFNRLWDNFTEQRKIEYVLSLIG